MGKLYPKKGYEKRASGKGPRKIKQRGSIERRIVNGWHVTKGHRDRKERDIAPSPAGLLYRSFLG